MKRIAPLLLSLLSAAAVAPAFAAAPAMPNPLAPGLTGPQRLEALVERVRLEQKALKTMEATFVQEQESSLLAAPEKSQGVFSYAAPDRIRWEYRSPSPISIVIRGDQMTTWYRDLKKAETLKVGRYSNQVFKYLGASGSLPTLLEYFTVKLRLPEKKGEAYRMELVPKYSRIAKRLKSMTLWVDDARFLPVRLRYVDADGDTTEYHFEDVKVNAPLPQDRFVLNIPKGVETRVLSVGGEGGEARPKP